MGQTCAVWLALSLQSPSERSGRLQVGQQGEVGQCGYRWRVQHAVRAAPISEKSAYIEVGPLGQVDHLARAAGLGGREVAADRGNPPNHPILPVFPGRSATASQVRAIHAIANRQRLDLTRELRNRFGVDRPDDLSNSQASELIDAFKAQSGDGGGRR